MSILRRKYLYYIIGTRATALLALMALVGCTSDSDTATPPTPTDGKVAVELALCVSPSQQATTRQSADVVQNGQDLSSYRGIQDLLLIPFATQGVIEADDVPMFGTIGTPMQQGSTTNYLTQNVDLLIGTASFLAYAKAKPLSGETETDYTKPSYKFKYGNLVQSDKFKNKMFATPADISFELENIKSDNTVHSKATALAAYMTSIANAEGWRTTSTPALKSLYDGFVTAGIIAGSSANVQATLTRLCKKLAETTWTGGDLTIANNIKSAIKGSGNSTATINADNFVTLEGSDITGYPANIHLPDGSAAMQWKIEYEEPTADPLVVTSATCHALSAAANGLDMNDQSRFAFPAELYYFANSQIRTSETSQASHYSEVGGTNGTAGTEANWNHVLASYSTTNTVVASTTRSVALENMLNYGVSCLEIKINAEGTEEGGRHYLNEGSQETANRICLEDNETSFPLTGVFVGGQYPVSFNFEPEDGTSETDIANERIIYDKKVETGIYLTPFLSNANYTLVLQSKKNKPVNIVLEFLNDSDKEFKGYQGGIISPGTHFYLTGKVIPKQSGDDKEQRVFKRDHKTCLTVTVKSLVNAYNVIPDLKSAQHDLEVTSVAVRQWLEDDSKSHTVHNW